MMPNYHDVIRNILEISNSMLVATLSSDWDMLVKLETQRNELLPLIFDDISNAQGLMPEIRSMGEAVLEIDRRIISICSNEAGDCQRQLSEYHQGRKVVAAYVANSA